MVGVGIGVVLVVVLGRCVYYGFVGETCTFMNFGSPWRVGGIMSALSLPAIVLSVHLKKISVLGKSTSEYSRTKSPQTELRILNVYLANKSMPAKALLGRYSIPE